MEFNLSEWIIWISGSPTRFLSLHWLCAFSIFIICVFLIAIMLTTFAYSGEIHKSISSGLSIYFIRGILIFALIYSCFALVIAIRFHSLFSAAGKATFLDLFMPKRGTSLFELLSHCILYYTSMMLAGNNPFLVLVNISLNSLIQMAGKNLILYFAYVSTTAAMIIIASKNEKNIKSFGKWRWAILICFSITGLAYILKMIRLLNSQITL